MRLYLRNDASTAIFRTSVNACWIPAAKTKAGEPLNPMTKQWCNLMWNCSNPRCCNYFFQQIHYGLWTTPNKPCQKNWTLWVCWARTPFHCFHFRSVGLKNNKLCTCHIGPHSSVIVHYPSRHLEASGGFPFDCQDGLPCYRHDREDFQVEQAVPAKLRMLPPWMLPRYVGTISLLASKSSTFPSGLLLDWNPRCGDLRSLLDERFENLLSRVTGYDIPSLLPCITFQQQGISVEAC